ncbi:hypothetical protein M9H77_36584 [Catharanthus roseus]|uniref:Uncharacterized protein n=1 Tax=Catharanthus roseus TaxID=4058 RepID=A0ACB9ZU27_CATRO|nr:hypothetical protein M9H77_36584 [Catharanthus roseus]
MRDRAKINAMRSGVVVLGALAFGYLTLELGFRPFLERAQQQQESLSRQQQLSKETPQTFSDDQ